MITQQDLAEAQDAVDELIAAEDELKRCGLSNLGIRWLERNPCAHGGELYCALAEWLRVIKQK